MAKDEDRLKLLKEIAGTRVYEQKRAESNKLMQETRNYKYPPHTFKKTDLLIFILIFTETKRAKIEEVLTYIQDRLLELDGEKTELSEYNELDKDRRSIEYTIYAREQSSANRKLEDLEEDRRRYISNSNSLRESYIKNDDTVQVIKKKGALGRYIC